MLLTFLGFAMVAVIVYLLLQEKMHPAMVFILVPTVAALLAGAGINEIAAMVKMGVGKTLNLAVLFIFSIIFFGVMSDAGMFDPLVNYLAKKAGDNVVMVTVATTLIATVAHLDGAFAATILITCPAMLPLYRRLNMRPVVMLVCMGPAMAIMNLVPWGGPTARVAAITGMDVNKLWTDLIPLQGVGLVIALAFAVYMGFVEKRRGAGYRPDAEVTAEGEQGDVGHAHDPKLKRPKLVLVNVVITLGVMGLLCFSKLPAYYDFMIGLALALLVNYPTAKEQVARIKAHSVNALSVPAVLLTTGIFLGVLVKTKMIDAMAAALIAIIPDFLGPYLHIIMGVTSVPVGMLLGTDSYFFGLLPLAINVGQKFGIDPINLSYAMLIGKNYGVLVTPHAATTYLAIGMAGGISLKEHLTFCTPRFFVLSIFATIAALAMGVISFVGH